MPTWRLWAAVGLSAGLLELPFPLAGPMPPWRSVFAWFGLAPLIWAVLSPACSERPRPLRRAFLLAWVCGVLWFMGNCYWIYDTMLIHGGLPPAVSVLILFLFSLVLGAYFGLFGWGLQLVRRATGSVRWALVFAPFLWVALELVGAQLCLHYLHEPVDSLGKPLKLPIRIVLDESNTANFNRQFPFDRTANRGKNDSGRFGVLTF